jgi:tRNA pseudouridine38-40 synthase
VGRTDAGVHARGQVVHVDVPADTDVIALQRAVNAMVGPDVVVRRTEPVAEGFDARRAARARHYRYLVVEAPTPDPLLARVAWTVPGPLDLRSMRASADALLGEHDFRAFCRRAPGTSPDDPIRRVVLATGWREVPWPGPELGPEARLLRFDVEAGSFCHQMVRSLVGTMIEVGRGRRRASDVHWLLRSGDRSDAPDPAPAHGLCLVDVRY